jgi:spermidine synthase
LAAGFYLLREYDMATATYVAASINGATALAAWLLAKVVDTRFENPESRVPIVRVQGTATVYVAIALSGLCALGAEVIWTRVLSLILGGTVYTFSLILAVFLIGLGIGAYAGSAILRRSTQPAPALAFCQLLLTVAVAWSAYMLSHSLPYWPVYPALSISPWISFQVDFVRCMLAVLPATLLWGASFPLALASAAGRNQDWANLIARIYAANTAGAIAGALVFSLAFIKWLGTERSEQTLMGISFAAGLIMLTSSPLVRRKVWATGAVIVSVLLILTVSPVPPALTAYGRLLPLRMGLVDPKTRTHVAPDILYQGDGLNASVAVSLSNGDVRNFHVSGKVEASSALKDMQLQRMLGYIPLMFHPRPRSILVVGFGAGVTAGTFVLHPGVEKIVICEIEPLIPQVVSRYFEKENNSVLHDPRVRLIYDDARHYILTTDEKFDIITSDPIHPWVKGSAALYTQEYFDLVRRHLNPGGIVSQWVPLYDTGKRTVKSELATFFRAFPNGTLWSTYLKGFGQDLVMMGGGGASSVNVDDANLQLYRPESAAMTKSLREVGFTSAIELFGTYTGRAVDLMPWLNDAEINHDRSLRLQYTAGSELNLDEGLVMYEEMIGYRKFPADLFAGSKALAEEVKYAIGRRK